jgi:hypothetical protein
MRCAAIVRRLIMTRTIKDDDKYREKRQTAYSDCCIEAYVLVAEALRHLGVAGDDNHDVIQADIELQIVDADRKEAVEQLQRAGALLYNAPLARVPDRIGAHRFWSVEEAA